MVGRPVPCDVSASVERFPPSWLFGFRQGVSKAQEIQIPWLGARSVTEALIAGRQLAGGASTKGNFMRRSILSLVLAMSVMLAGSIPAAAAQPEKADVLSQGGGSVYAPDGARLVRQPNGIAVSVRMPTPQPDSYLYPSGAEPGHPEVFTLWMFVFNHPEECAAPNDCGPGDMTNPDVEFGVYNPAGHVAADGTLTLAGRVGVGDTAGAPPGITAHDLSNPAGAEVHLAVTSHGGLDPSTLPNEFHIPTGSGGCGCWWVAIFD